MRGLAQRDTADKSDQQVQFLPGKLVGWWSIYCRACGSSGRILNLSVVSAAGISWLAKWIRRLYLGEELITRGDRPCWAQAVALEIVRAGRAA